MRKRDLQGHLDAMTVELEASNAELHRLRAAQRELEKQRAALQSELEAERLVQRTMPNAPAHRQVVENAPERRIVHLQATVIDERAKQAGDREPPTADEEAREHLIQERLAIACRDAENLLSVAESSPIVRAARYALAFALRDSERLAGEAQLEAGAGRTGGAARLPAGEQTSAPGSDAAD